MNTAIKIILCFILVLTGTAAQARPLYMWQIFIEGQTLSMQFQREGIMYALVPGLNNDPNSTSGYNAFDAVLVSGDPSGMSSNILYPPTGSFEFSTHMIWYNLKFPVGSPQIDLAFVQLEQSCATMTPDTNRLTFAEQQIINTFSALGATHVIDSGYIQICSNDGFQTLYGTIDVTGYNAIGLAPARYTAFVQGWLYSISDTGW